MFQQLRQHPNIWMPPIKELHFFDHLFCEENRKWTRWHIETCVRNLIKHEVKSGKINIEYLHYLTSLATGSMFDEKWYGKAFNRKAAENKTIGDITPEYCTIGKDGIRYLSKLLNNPKLLWLIREPVSRALSQLRMNVNRSIGTQTISEDVWMEHAKNPAITNRGNLSLYIPQWEEEFGQDKIFYLSFKDIARNPSDLLHKAENFLEVPKFDKYPDLDKVVHEGTKVDIPVAVIEYLSDQLKGEVDFLASKFGESFI